jgi:ABC-2 type transport system permease protein
MTTSILSRTTGFSTGDAGTSAVERTKRVWEYRRILKLLVVRDLKVRYAGSLLGYVWTVLEPLLMTLVYFFMFTKIFHRTAGADFSPYMLYLITGQLPWFWFANSVQASTRAMRAEAQMVRSTNVPRELWVLRVVASKFVEYFFSLPVLALFALAYAVKPTIYIFLLPLAWVMETVLLIGVGLVLAPLNVLVRDVERIVPVIVRVLFFASPVLYSIEQAPKPFRLFYSFNPCVGFLQLTRAAFFPAALYQKHHGYAGGHPVIDHVRVIRKNGVATVTGKAHLVGGHRVTTTVDHWNWIWHSAVVSVIILAIGMFLFTRLERPVLKEI